MIEPLIEKLITALDANTEALKSGASAVGATGETKPQKASKGVAETGETKPAKAPKSTKPTKTQAEVNAALIKLKDTYKAEEAKAIITKVGGVDRMGEIPEDKYDEVYNAAVKRFDELSAETGEGAADDGL